VSARSPDHAALGRAVAHARHERGISQEDLAAKAGIHTTYLSGIERGRSNPTWTVLLSLSKALRLRPAELIEAAEQQMPR
jgi:transcriptional regulator with XRE-family HTH domain